MENKKMKNDTDEKIDSKYENEIKYCFGHKENENIWESFLLKNIFAHRGIYDNEFCPENSLMAFENAIQKGYGIELDVQPIADGTPVVFHDSKMSRMTGKDKYIQNLSNEELSKITLLNTNINIPTLKDVLKFVNGRVPLLIELKSQDKVGELEPKVFELLKEYEGEFAIQSFNPYQIEWFYKNAPKIWRGQLASFFKGEKLGSIKKFVLKRLKMQKITHHNFVNYDFRNIPNRFTKKLNVPLLTWTVRNQNEYIKAIQNADNVVFEGFDPHI